MNSTAQYTALKLEACRAFARMMNAREFLHLEPWLSNDLVYTSQWVMEELRGKISYRNYICDKLDTIRSRRASVWAEIGYVDAEETNPCVLLGEGDERNLTATLLIELVDDHIARMAICSIPLPLECRRTGERPYFFYANKDEAIKQALEWMDLDRRCGGYAAFCLKCDGVLQLKFDNSNSTNPNISASAIRNTLADILCLCTLEDLQKHEPLQWLIALLNTANYERFVTGIANLAPYSGEVAWQIIRISEHNKGNSCFILEPYRMSLFKPRFHLHPTVAPSLLAAMMRPGADADDVIALFDYFEPVANDYPVLRQALPLWHAELKRRADTRKADEAKWLQRQEQTRVQDAQDAAKRKVGELDFLAIEARGPQAVVSAVLEAPSLGGWDCSPRWAKLSEKDLADVPPQLLEQVIQKMSQQKPPRLWHGLRSRIKHCLKSRAHSAERTALLAQMEDYSLPDKLRAACDSNWSLTYFPEAWAVMAIQDVTVLSSDLKASILPKVSRLRRRSPWRSIRQLIIP